MPTNHDVANQVPALVDYNVADDVPLVEGLQRESADWAAEELQSLGELAGSEQAQEWGRLANECPPVLHTHDTVGNRLDEVEFHPHYHSLMATAAERGLNAAAWLQQTPGAHAARIAKAFVWAQTDAGHMCPTNMSYSAVPALRDSPEIVARYEKQLGSPLYDPKPGPLSTKQSLVFGMSMTEKQGGSDLRANTTTATPTADGTYRITGHKWFTSAPMCDAFLAVAQTTSGLSCFLLPRILPDGSRNGIHFQRLKSKLGNRSNASAEVEYDQAVGELIGEEGRGIRTIMQMVNYSRLGCLLMSAAFMRKGLVRAMHHARHRKAFGSPLVETPLMGNVLSDLALESEAAITVMMRLAGATDRANEGNEDEAEFRRLGLAVSKYWVCKRAQHVVGEALECLGGNGYVEDSGMPRLYREAPLQSVWEGAGNVAALDVLRAIKKSPESLDAFLSEVKLAQGSDPRLDAAVLSLTELLGDTENLEFGARRLVERMALVLQGSLLVRFSDPAVADAFCASRLDGDWGAVFGTLGRTADTRTILERVPTYDV
ncbi:acyl-CoA dehydrogenase family protein [Saccharopolyspora sp. NPDC050389]|uniref:acyl-CoA dehydrogenase family protein n=1 Tax=Saccharopolyspora sp. NPDC050389 TaxID=3155516 RepID=UPI00340F51DB